MSMQHYTCDLAVIGGGMGGVAAALAAADAGVSVVLTEATDWIGGQMTNQGVSALDEHPYIEQWGGTRSYYAMRNAIRAYYREHYDAPAIMPDGQPLNPGNGWVSRLCFEPVVGVHVLETMLAAHVAAGRIRILREHTPIAATVEADRVHNVTLQDHTGQRCTITANFILDATELGDLLPLTGAEYVTGAEAIDDTGETHANPNCPQPNEVQGFTFCFAVEHRPGENHTIIKPEGYEQFRDAQP
jgi:flavin-dependent dehydrogenase